MNNTLLQPTKNKRITSLDALRAFTLLGILIVHANNGFGLSYKPVCLSCVDSYCSTINALFISSKCNTIFAVLFGVSFYLILRNPNNSSGKFVWRCFLLTLIGLFNKLFYSFDALMWYGLWGMVLVLFRNLKPKILIASCVCIQLIGIYLAKFKLGDLFFGAAVVDRYGMEKSFYDVLTYPNAVIDYLRIVLNDGVLGTLAKFLFGYWIAKVGFIESLKRKLTKRFLLITWFVFVVLFVADFFLQKNGVKSLRMLNNICGSAAYASALIYAYYNCELCNRVLKLFEPYGKLGLTNYSVGGILGVFFINEFGLGLYKDPLSVIVLFFIGFFLLQALFSYYWLRYFTYGPLEYVWRVATERKKIPFRRETLA